MRCLTLKLLLLLSAFPLTCSGIDLVEFEDTEPSDHFIFAVYEEDGFEFSAPKKFPAGLGGGMFFRDSSLIAPNPDPAFFQRPVNGTKYVASFTGSEPVLRRADGGAFRMHSLNLAEYSSAVAKPYPVSVTGFFVGGGTITRVITLDGHVDALPDPPDFESFTFGEEWTDLLEVRFLASYPGDPSTIIGNSFDNFAVTAIPEPAMLPAGLFALALYLLAKRLPTKRSTE